MAATPSTSGRGDSLTGLLAALAGACIQRPMHAKTVNFLAKSKGGARCSLAPGNGALPLLPSAQVLFAWGIGTIEWARHMARRATKRGFSLIEVLLALGVLALLLAAAFAIYPQVRDRALVNEEISNLRALVAGLHARFPSGDYRGVTSAYVAKAGLLPSIYLRPDGNGLLNRWGDTMYVSGYGEGTNPNDPSQRMRRVQIDYKGFPQKHCVALVSGLTPFADAVYVGTFGGTLGTADTKVDPGNVGSIVARCTQTSTVPNTEDKLVMLIFIR